MAQLGGLGGPPGGDTEVDQNNRTRQQGAGQAGVTAVLGAGWTELGAGSEAASCEPGLRGEEGAVCSGVPCVSQRWPWLPNRGWPVQTY